MLRVALLLAVTSCSDSAHQRPVHELVGTTMGTNFSVQIVVASDEFDGTNLQQQIERRLEALDARFSNYKANSELSRFNANRSTAPIPVSKEFCEVVDRALRLSERTDGAFDITIAPLVNSWGFGAVADASVPPDNETITRLMKFVGYQNLHSNCKELRITKDVANLTIDLSAIVKGYAVDEVAVLLEQRLLMDYLVEIGGELRARGRNGRSDLWAVGIETPSYNSRSVQTVVPLDNTGIATSGDYRNFIEIDGTRYSHTIDPNSGRPVTHAAASVSVIDPSVAFADAMATALLVLGPEAGLALAEREGIAAMFLLRDGADFEQQTSTRFSAILTQP